MSEPIVREFTNELGSAIRIEVWRDVPDSDLVCAVCRWRGGHSPVCARAAEPWPTHRLPDDKTLLRIVGPTTISENFLTAMEAAELCQALAAGQSLADSRKDGSSL